MASSLTNFALGIIIARNVSPTEFGAWAILYWSFIFALNVARAFGANPLVMRYSHVERTLAARATAQATGTATVVGLVCAVIAISLGFLGIAGGPAAIILGIGLPLLLLQDAYRFVFMAAGRALEAFLSDTSWAVVMGLLLVVGRIAHIPNSLVVILAYWEIGAAAGAVYALVRSPATPTFGGIPSWIREHRAVLPGLAAGTIISVGSQTLTTYALAGWAGLEVVASIRAGSTLLSPIYVVFQGIMLVAGPDASRTVRTALKQLPQRLAWLSGILAAVAIAGAIVAMALPETLGRALLGQNWPLAGPVLPGLSVSMTLGLMIGTTGLGMFVLRATNRSARLTFAGAIITAILTIGAGVWGGAVAAVWGGAVAAGIQTVLFLQGFRVSYRTYVPDPVPTD
jgi:O-antigen/teichoic acid export membrane protein